MSGWSKISKITRENQRVRYDKRVLRSLGKLKTWQLVVVLAILTVLTAMFLRMNNLGMIDLRENLVKADETGNLQSVNDAAVKLRDFTANHMNTSAGKIPLQTLYNQAAQQAIDASRPPEINSAAYIEAQNSCMPNLKSYGYASWAQCVAGAVGLSDINSLDQNNLPPPDPDAFYVDFASARWSPDLAGFSLLISAIIGLLIVFKVFSFLILRFIIVYKTRKTERI